MAFVLLDEDCLHFDLVRDSTPFGRANEGALGFIPDVVAGDFDFECYSGDDLEFMMVAKMSLRFTISCTRFEYSV